MIYPQEIFDYEDGSLTIEETIDFFQRLIDSGIAWQLQGHYGRLASQLIEDGCCTPAK